jgi:hypothetical protein
MIPIGTLLLTGLTFVNQNGEQIEQYQTHGIVSELTNGGLLEKKRRQYFPNAL